jgi:hypothetical protein
MRVVPLDRPSKGHQPLQVFLFFIFDLEYFIPPSRNTNQSRAALWRIFSSNKSVPANRKTGFYANREQNKQEVRIILPETAQNFEVFLNIQE